MARVIRGVTSRAKHKKVLKAVKENNENINSFMSNSFGFGGTNACLIFSKD